MPFNEGVVPEITTVPVASGKVSVRLVEVPGLAMVNMPVPEASGAREIFDIIYTPVSSAAIRASSALIVCAWVSVIALSS
jgi:hypothetical protein